MMASKATQPTAHRNVVHAIDVVMSVLVSTPEDPFSHPMAKGFILVTSPASTTRRIPT